MKIMLTLYRRMPHFKIVFLDIFCLYHGAKIKNIYRMNIGRHQSCLFQNLISMAGSKLNYIPTTPQPYI